MLGIASCTLIKSVDVPLLYTHHPRALMHWMGILIVCPSSCSLFFSFTTRAVPQLHFFSPSKKNVSPPVYKPCCKRSWGVTKPDVSQYCQDETNSNRKVLAAAAAAADSTAASTQVPGDKANNPNKNKPAKRKDRLLRWQQGRLLDWCRIQDGPCSAVPSVCVLVYPDLCLAERDQKLHCGHCSLQRSVNATNGCSARLVSGNAAYTLGSEDDGG